MTKTNVNFQMKSSIAETATFQLRTSTISQTGNQG
jgi:hypothetical protein